VTRLGDLTWPQVVGDVLVLPLGATEQHGPHLPISTDADIAGALALGLADRRPGVVVAPTLPYGASGEHAGFSGTLSIGHDALELVLVELIRSANDTWSHVLLLNAHGGNLPTLKTVVARMRDESRDVLLWTPPWRGDAHAGRTETSVQLALDPSRVGPGRDPGATEGLAELMPELRRAGLRAVTDNGVLGDPTGASSEEGEELLAQALDDLEATVRTWLTVEPA